MKTTIKTIILAAASLFAAMSCQKETAGTQDLVKEGETIQVSINAGLGDFVAADATKATAKQVVRLEWGEDDKVDAYYGNNKISGDARISVTPSENKIFAKLSGTITAPSGHDFVDDDIITFVYSNAGTGLTFDFSSQDGTIPFVAYATVKYGEIKSGLTDKMVEFKFATSVMKIAATNLGGGAISSAAIDGINTKVTLTPKTNSEDVTIEGNTLGTITKTAGSIDASSDQTRAIFTVGLVQDSNTGRKLTINGWEADLTDAPIAAGKSYTTPCAFEGVKDVAYVIIGGKKWATMNLGATTVNDYGNYYSWGDQINGTYFSNYGYSQREGSRINNTNNPWNKMKHDAAYYELGGNWRVPSTGDFIALDLACGGNGSNTQHIPAITADDIDEGGKVKQGKYWLAAGQSFCTNYTVAGMLYSDGANELFFPAAGHYSDSNLNNSGKAGVYHSSIYKDKDFAYRLYFGYDENSKDYYVYPQSSSNMKRFLGISIRPVSD